MDAPRISSFYPFCKLFVDDEILNSVEMRIMGYNDAAGKVFTMRHGMLILYSTLYFLLQFATVNETTRNKGK